MLLLFAVRNGVVVDVVCGAVVVIVVVVLVWRSVAVATSLDNIIHLGNWVDCNRRSAVALANYTLCNTVHAHTHTRTHTQTHTKHARNSPAIWQEVQSSSAAKRMQISHTRCSRLRYCCCCCCCCCSCMRLLHCGVSSFPRVPVFVFCCTERRNRLGKRPIAAILGRNGGTVSTRAQADTRTTLARHSRRSMMECEHTGGDHSSSSLVAVGSVVVGVCERRVREQRQRAESAKQTTTS